MFSAILCKKPLFFNEGLRKYCLQSTNGYIKTLVEKYETERMNNVKYLTDTDGNIVVIHSPLTPDGNSKNFIVATLCFLSVVTVMHLFYKSNK